MVDRLSSVSPLLVALALAACTPSAVPLWSSSTRIDIDDYEDQLDLWTRRGETYRAFESRLFAYATYQSWIFRRAQVRHRARTERLSRADVATLLGVEKERHAKAHHFFLATHTHEWAWNHFERTGEAALWRLRLLNDAGESVAPLQVERLGTSEGRFTSLYPYYGGFYVGYRVSFPKETVSGKPLFRREMKHFRLRLSGPQAAMDLIWMIAPSDS